MLRSHTRAILLLATCITGIQFTAPLPAREPDRLTVLSGGYPRTFFFRSAEGFAANPNVTYDRWEAAFSRLMGIQGKVLDEEVPGRELRNVDFFTRFKQQHPEQLVLLHYNGNARDPRYQTIGKYFAGHWVYHNGAKIIGDVPPDEGETEIRVSDASLFRTNVGRYRDKNEDIGLCALDENGKPNWRESEQVQLIAVDVQGNTIRIRRGCYGTKPRAFRGGTAYAAAHVHEGPWGHRSHLMWFYNHSTCCPRDAAGRSCSDVHVAELAARFGEGGELVAFDGVQFDVLHNHCGQATRNRGPDCDADGQPDGGVFDGVNQYGAGVVLFCRQLRTALGEETLVLADGHGSRHQRAFGLLNGIESEGWPSLGDWEIKDWSGGLNRHAFWRANGRPPVFNYINHKFTAAGEKPGQRVRPDVPWNVHRLVFAAAMFTDSAVCYSFTPPRQQGEIIGLWDELVNGTEKQVGWLGQPLGPAVHFAKKTPNLLLDDEGLPSKALVDRLTGDAVRFERIDGAVKVSSTDPEAGQIRFLLPHVPCEVSDLFVAVSARAAPRADYPPETARLAWVGIAAPAGEFVRRELPPGGMAVRGKNETSIEPESGASVRWVPHASIGHQAKPAYLVHPPYRNGTGYTFWQRDITIPDHATLELFTGMGENAPGKSDGVVFRVEIGLLENDDVAEFEKLWEHKQIVHRWILLSVPLQKWSGKRVRLKFISDCGPNDNSTTDHSYWGDVVVVGPFGREGRTAPVRHMTWMNATTFESSFYFPHVKSPTVDLEFVVEGSEPVWLSSVTAHAQPDVMYREFEHGVVLANPSPRPWDFFIAGLFPGSNFRRLRGSSEQDAATNNGQFVGRAVQLRPQEGLFLVRE